MLLPLGAGAETLRCGGQWAELGDTRAAVRGKCGEPWQRDEACRSPRFGAGTPGGPVVLPGAVPGKPPRAPACVAGEEWTYRPGPGQFLTTLRFEEGRLVEIRYGDRIR
ncbi:hypothetical protein ISF6_3582 [Piscinibacter sakaiensis]|uniref:DUF2845 domain-containing protein n=1 Tax=Piscinibacter sakaiensis TaxID=1547922 RepID=A0A0K8P4Q1_PISS1|nr:hypothetical protein ISF6_3582 [Piscinibacter sakaiensis]